MHIPVIYQKVLPVQGDLEKEEDVKALLDAAIKHFGKLDILVSSSLQYSNFHYFFYLTGPFFFFFQVLNAQSSAVCGDKIKELLGYVLYGGQGMSELLQITPSILSNHMGSVLAVDNLH